MQHFPSHRIVSAAVILLLLLTVALAARSQAAEGCYPIKRGIHTPTGIAGCTVYGEGIASTWPGPGAARNDCTYPWTDCQPVKVQSLQTGLVIQVQPTQYCDCYTGIHSGRYQERLIDLDPAMVNALGLDISDGLFPVRVTPVDSIPDTALR